MSVRAPFTTEQVEAIDRWQGEGRFHPLTCPADGTQGSDKHSNRRILVASYERLECAHCSYVQHWVPDCVVGQVAS